MKKLTAVLLVLVLAVSFAACGKAKEEEKPDPNAKGEGVMTWSEYIDADLDAEVVIEAYVQAKQSWDDGKASLYLQDPDGAYFVYNASMDQDTYSKLFPSVKVKVTGYKAAWSGEVEIAEGAAIEIEEGEWLADALDVTDLLGTDDLLVHQNEYVSFKGMTVEPSKDPDGNDVAFLYKWNGSGTDGDDLYFNVSVNGNTYSFVVESSLYEPGDEVYEAIKALNIGDVVDMNGFLYWYEGPNPHIVQIAPAQ